MHPNNEVRMGEAGACEVVAALLRRHMGSAWIAEKCCAAITNLAISDANKNRLGDAEVCDLVVSALTKHIAETSVVEAACLSFRNLSANNDSNKMLSWQQTPVKPCCL